MIKPTVGRVVWYHPASDEVIIHHPDQPLAAHIAYVWSDTMVDLMVIDHNGVPHAKANVRLVGDDDYGFCAPKFESWCEWMPYQKAVASGKISPVLHAGDAKDENVHGVRPGEAAG